MRVTITGTALALRGGTWIGWTVAAAMSLGFAVACSGSDHHTAAGAPKATVSRPKTAHGKGGKDSDAGANDGASSHAIDNDDDAGNSGEGPIPVGHAGDAGSKPTQPGTEEPPPEDAGRNGAIDSGTPPPLVTLMVDYDGDPPPADKLPTPKGKCPKFDGVADYTFDVQGGRQVLIGVDASKAPKKGPGGPLIFYWHGTGGGPTEAVYGLGDAVLAEIANQGGMVVGFYSTMNWPDKGTCDECKSNTGNGVWFIEDFNLADEVLACAIEQLHIDTRRIHTMGMSAGGLQASAMLYARSNYLASVAPYSGGILAPRTRQDPDNHVAAMIFHGTYADDVVGLHFYSTSKTFFNDVKNNGGFAIDCNHGGAHIIPAEGGPAVWMFFQLHPYKTASPWATMLPPELPAYCSLTFQEE